MARQQSIGATVKPKLKKVPLNHIVWKSSIRDFTEDDIKNMATSLRVHGQIQPIVCKPPNEEGLHEGVCGRLRYEGAKHASIPEILVRVYEFKSESEVLDWQLAENLHRKDLTSTQIAEAFKKLYEKRKEEVGGVKDKAIVTGIAESLEKLTGNKKAERTIEQYIQIAKELPKEVKDKIVIDHDFGVQHAVQLLRLKDKPEKQVELVEEFKKKPVSVRKLKEKVTKILTPKPEPLPEGLFDVIYADPPWSYEVSHLACSPNQHYQTMTTEELCDKRENLKEHIAENAVIFLWATNPILEDAFKVMDAWGFRYKTNMVWIKDKTGVGFWFRGQHELLLLGVKGKVSPPEDTNRFSSVLSTPVGTHSEKPKNVYEIIEKMFPFGKYLELFARQKREGWTSWGAEVNE